MTTVRQPQDPEADPRVKAVFDDIRATRKTEFVNNLWRTLAFDPPLLAIRAVRASRCLRGRIGARAADR
jgi:hypothetical protein